MKLNQFIATLAGVLLVQGIAIAQVKPTVQVFPKEAPKSVAFIGNSFITTTMALQPTLDPSWPKEERQFVKA